MMQSNTKNMLVQDGNLNTPFKKPKARVLVGMFLVCLSLVGHGGVGLASEVNGSLQIHHESVTGSVSQLPLRLILDQFQEQLGVEYQATKEELEQRVSVDLHGESLPQALAKILAQWDYALTIDPAGKVQEIIVVRKIPKGGTEETAIKAEKDRNVAPHSMRGSQRDVTFTGEPQGAVVDERQVASPAFGTSPSVIQQELPQHDENELQDAMDAAGMGMIPPTGHPEMEVYRVSSEAEKAILQSLNPSTMGSLEGAGYQDMNIAPVSEEEAQDILRSLTQSIGRSREASFP